MKNIMIHILFNKFRQILQKDLWALIILTFLCHEFFVLLINYVIPSVANNVTDSVLYFNSSSEISYLMHNGTYSYGQVYSSHWYPSFLGLIFFIFTPSLFLGLNINILLISLSAVMLYKLASVWVNDRKVVFWLVILVMNTCLGLMFHSSLLLKEVWIIFLMLGIFLISNRMFTSLKFRWLNFTEILFLYLALHNLRFFVGYAVIFGFLVGWLSQSVMSWRQRFAYGVFMFVVVFGVTFSVTYLDVIKDIGGPKFQDVVRPSFIYKTRSDYFRNGSTTTNIQVIEKKESVDSLLGDSVKESYGFSITGIFKSFSTVVFGPFPWQVSFKKYLIVFMDLLVWYPVLFLGILGMVKLGFKKSSMYLGAMIIILASLVMGVDNAGALIRYRLPLFIIFSIFTPTGFLFIRKRKDENFIHNN